MSAQILFDLPWSEYIKGGYLGSSAFADWGSCGLASWSRSHLEEGYSDDGGSKWTAAGSAIDRAITGDPHGKPIIVKPDDVDYRTKAGKEWRDRHADHEVIDSKQDREIRAATPLVREAIGILHRVFGGEVHYQVTLRGEVSGLPVQTRPDMMVGVDMFPDLKYVNPNDFAAFDRKFCDSRYRFQAGLGYGLAKDAGIEHPQFAFLLAESCTDLPRVEVVQVPPRYLVACWDEVRRVADDIAEVKASPLGFVDRIVTRELSMPHYAEARMGIA